MQTFFYIISISENNKKSYFQELTANGMPFETKERKSAHKFSTAQDAHKYAAAFNSNLRFAYKQNGVPADKQYFYNVETISTAVHTFFVTVEIVKKDETAKEYQTQYKSVCSKFREKFTGTFEDAQEYIRNTFAQTPGYLHTAKIESLKDGICGPRFVQEYSWDPGEHTNYYIK